MAVIDIVRTTPFAGPRTHAASARGGLNKSMSIGIRAALATRRLARACLIANIPALIRADCRRARRSDAANPFAAPSRPISPLRVSTVEPTGTDATPFSEMNPLSWNGARIPRNPNRLGTGSFTNTSPEICRTTVLTPATGGTLPGASSSQTLPTRRRQHRPDRCSRPPGSCRSASGTPSPSPSTTGAGTTV